MITSKPMNSGPERQDGPESMSPANDEKLNTNITVRFKSGLADRLARAAKQPLEDRSVSEVVRKLIEWAMPHYEKHGNFVDLYRNLPPPKRRSVTP